MDILEDANKFFHMLLRNGQEASSVRRYVRSRGLETADVRAFELGYAPNGWRGLSDHLVSVGWAEADILAAGLGIQAQAGHVYDRFRHRLMFPIRDRDGRLAGFGGRALGDKNTAAKYINSPASDWFDKSRLLYGLNVAQTDGDVVLVEGYLDVITAHKYAQRNVVAQMGTATTEAQFSLLGAFSGRIILALDADAAGRSAVMRCLRVACQQVTPDAVLTADGLLAQQPSLLSRLYVLRLPDGDDPDKLLRRDPAHWQRLVEEATPILSYAIAERTRDVNLDDLGQKMGVINDLAPALRAIRDDGYLGQLSAVMGVSETALHGSIYSTTFP